MRVSLYNFSTPTRWGGALSFSEGEALVVLDSARDPLWWLVLGSEGRVGYAPANYLTEYEMEEEDDLGLVEKALEDILERVRVEQGGVFTWKQREDLRSLRDYRKVALIRSNPVGLVPFTPAEPFPYVPLPSPSVLPLPTPLDSKPPQASNAAAAPESVAALASSVISEAMAESTPNMSSSNVSKSLPAPISVPRVSAQPALSEASAGIGTRAVSLAPVTSSVSRAAPAGLAGSTVKAAPLAIKFKPTVTTRSSSASESHTPVTSSRTSSTPTLHTAPVTSTAASSMRTLPTLSVTSLTVNTSSVTTLSAASSTVSPSDASTSMVESDLSSIAEAKFKARDFPRQPVEKAELKSNLGRDLVERVRANMTRSNDPARVAVVTVLTLLSNNVGSLCGVLDEIIGQIESRGKEQKQELNRINRSGA